MNKNLTNEGLLEGPFLFIVNPRSGTGGARLFADKVKQIKSRREFNVVDTKSKEHGEELINKNKANYSAIIAVGGDGTVHDTGTQLIGSNTALGIIPTGSGNGIARHFGISMLIGNAIREMLVGKFTTMDTFTANGVRGIGFFGMGFDAFVAEKFAHSKERGFSNYVKLTLDAIARYQPTVFNIDGQSAKALTLIHANIDQFGNNAVINPNADASDGLIQQILVSAPPIASFPSLASRLFLNSFTKSKFAKSKSLSTSEIINEGNAATQIDGEPFGRPNKVEIICIPRSLRIIIP